MTDTLGIFSGAIRSAFNRVPVPFVSRSSGGRLVRGFGDYGRRAQLSTTEVNSDLYSIVNRTSTSTAAVNWRLYRTAASGKTEDREEVLKHQALRVWKKPNNFYTGREFVEAGQQHNDLTGETWWVVERASIPGYGPVTFPTGMWVVRPDRMVPIPDVDDFLAGYMYIGPSGEEVALTVDQVILTKIPSPLDPYRGMGPVQSLMLTLEGAQAAEAYDAAFFTNGAMPGGLLKTPNMLGDGDFNRISSRWREQHKGTENAHRVAILEGGLDFTPVTYSRKDMQRIESDAVTSDKIKRAFGISGFALGQLEDANRASSEAASAWFAQNLTVPRLDRIKDALNYTYLPMFGDTASGLEFDYDNPVEPDQDTKNATLQAQTEAYAKLIAAGVDPADAARVCGLPEMRILPASVPATVGAAA